MNKIAYYSIFSLNIEICMLSSSKIDFQHENYQPEANIREYFPKPGSYIMITMINNNFTINITLLEAPQFTFEL